MILALAVILTSAYVLLFCFFIYGVSRLKTTRHRIGEPTLSIVVAARNEEETIHRSLESLANLDYPVEKLEVILVDDQSTDQTYRIMQSAADRNKHFKVVSVTGQEGHLRGKANAIAIGIDQSHGEIIFLTDSDCVVPRSWIRAMLNEYDERTGLVASYTLLDSNNSFEGMQSLDWAFLHTLAAGGVGLKRPLSCFGNNLTFRRRAYDEVGGYRNVPFSVTEDFALFTAITRKKSWKYGYLLSPESLVMSLPCKTLGELLRQKKRWVVGGLDMKAKGMVLMALGFCVNTFLLLVPLLGFSLLDVLAVWIPKLLIDALILAIPLGRIRALSFMKYFPAFEVYYFLYMLALPLLAFTGRKVHWKGRQF
jgi:cellulose synthase/poly-beta-1,6-N-acetylglucosamine synthase-like glycosyltransferase